MYFPLRFRLFVSVGAALVALSCAFGVQMPDWWSQRELTNGHPADDFAAANLGQLKYITAKAVAELDAHLSGGAGQELHDLIVAWNAVPVSGVVRDDYAILNQGQLKTVAQKIYDRLHAAGWHDLPLASGRIYPWTTSTADDDAYAAVNIGQLKYVFSFNLNTRAVALFSPSPFTTEAQATLRARITLPDGIQIAGITLNGQPVSLSLLQDGMLAIVVNLNAGLNSFRLIVTDAQGHSYYGDTEITRITGSISQLTISQPAAGAIIAARSVDVTGTWGGAVPLRTLKVNGYPAICAGSLWSAQAIPLVNGANILTVTATDEAGRTATLTRSVTASYTANSPAPLILTANVLEGPAPLSVTFTAQLNVSGTIQKVDYYFSGRGQADVSATTLAPKSYIYPQAGNYYPTVTVLLTDGTSYSSGGISTPLAQRLRIHVTGAGDDQPLAVWTAFGAALAAQDAEAAAFYLGSQQVQQWRDFISVVGVARISKMQADLANLSETVVLEDIMQYHASVDTPFGRVQFPVNFIREEGAWKIKGF